MFRNLLALLIRAALSLRYRIRVHRAEQLRGLRGPALMLPNHPSFTDAVTVFASLWPWLHRRPVLYEDYCRNPLLAPFAKLLRAVRVPDLTRASVEARQRPEQAIAALIAALR